MLYYLFNLLTNVPCRINQGPALVIYHNAKRKFSGKQYLNCYNSSFCWKFYTTSGKQSSPTMSEGQSDDNIFVGDRDRYDGMIVCSEKNHCAEDSAFTTKLLNSVEKWKKEGVRGLWFNLTLEYAFWVPILAKNGFTFHHAEGNNVSMTRWLPDNETSGIPGYAHTMTGAGAIVVNDQNEILVVSEKYKVVNTFHWKLPGGYIERDETIQDAAVREVYEETGIKTKFESLVAFRHSQRAAFGCCDVYFVVALSPLPDGENVIKKDSRELEACEWMKIDDYVNHEQVLENNRMIVKNYMACKKAGIRIKGEKTFHKLLKRQQTLFTIDIEV